MRLFFATLACLSFALPAFAGETPAQPRLAPGGFDLGVAQQRSELMGGNGFSVGAATSTPQPGRLAVGGYAAYGIDERSEAAVNLGVSGALPFSPNASQPGTDLLVTQQHPALSLTLSVHRDLSSGLSLGGYAAATRPQATGGQPAEDAPDYRVGAGVGVKF